MKGWISAAFPSAPRLLLTKATWVNLGMAGVLTATWLWCCWCGFPAIPWNDVRVAPAVALHHGISIYSPAATGPISTWIYGPLPLLLMWPAGLASSAIGAIEIAGVIHIGGTVLALVLACLLWPASRVPASVAQDWQRRLAAALLCVLLVRNQNSGYLVYCADAPGVAFGLLALLALTHRRLWLAAGFAAAAVACKQTLVGVGMAQVIWLYVVVSPRAAWQQLGRCVLAGSAVALSAIWMFGGAGLWHTMMELPSRFPWANPAERLGDHTSYLLIHVILPVAVMAGWRGFFFNRKSPVLLPSIAFFCTLPFSLAGLLKIGGNANSLHSFWLWFPLVLTAVARGPVLERLGQVGSLAMATAALALASLWLQISHLPVRPNIQAYREATYLAARLPGKIWFPSHPLVTLYSDRRFYHHLDGLGERSIAGQRITDEHFFAHMPRKRQASATLLPVGWGLADMAEGRLPSNAGVRTFGLWRIDGHLD